MTHGIESILDRLWSDYTHVNPRAQRIHQLLADRGDRVVNDHIALRTLRHPKLGIDVTARLFEHHGYSAKDEYEFPEKKLHARHYEHENPALPTVFISELKLEELSRGLRDIVDSMMRQVSPAELPEDAFVLGGCLWHRILKDTYETLRQESEYAAWVAAFGFRANHFTVSVNELESFDSLEALNDFLKEQGFVLNDVGGEIKGSPPDLLQQSSTLAEPCEVRFADGMAEIPGCCCEFAYRYPLPSGERFSGFVAQSAEPIFESTDHRVSS
ncbi:MAG: DUF1338 domain-containing protein [Halofilum sp. (in: g-proteobacteria)]|nr:DUF1338 domain-containing protein [Halofilum sp. (in: g-proteobacteria)]